MVNIQEDCRGSSPELRLLLSSLQDEKEPEELSGHLVTLLVVVAAEWVEFVLFLQIYK